MQLIAHFGYAAAELVLERPRTGEERAGWLHKVCVRAIRGLDIEVAATGGFPDRGALISNHLSYLDILVYASLHPCAFVAKAEMEHWPVVGWMTTMAGTVYVERGRGGSAKRARDRMDAILEEEIALVFFPEGTTSSGDGVLRFHSGLLGQVTERGYPVTAAFIRYSLPLGSAGATVREDVHFWGETPMIGHIVRLLSLRGVRAEVVFAPGPIEFTTEPPPRKLAAVEARKVVCGLGGVSAELIPEA